MNANWGIRQSDGAEEGDGGLLGALAEGVVAQEGLDQGGVDAARDPEHVHADVVGVDDRHPHPERPLAHAPPTHMAIPCAPE